MSGIPSNTDPSDLQASPVSHHIHKTEEPLPGAKGAAPTFDYSPDTIEHAPESVLKQEPPKSTHTPHSKDKTPSEAEHPHDVHPHDAHHHTHSHAVEPHGAHPIAPEVAALAGQQSQPEPHVGFGEKIIGKVEKVIGKVTHNPELQEKGELKETGGKIAAPGQAGTEHI